MFATKHLMKVKIDLMVQLTSLLLSQTRFVLFVQIVARKSGSPKSQRSKKLAKIKKMKLKWLQLVRQQSDRARLQQRKARAWTSSKKLKKLFVQDHRPLCSVRRQGLVAWPEVARVRASKFQLAAVSRLDERAREYCVNRSRGQLLAPIFHRAWPTSRYLRATFKKVSSTFLTVTWQIVRATVCAQSMMTVIGPL